MDPKDRKQIVGAELASRARRRTKLDPGELLFGEQLKFALDESHNIAACCSRRSGKTYGIAFKLLKKAHQFPGCYCLYIVQSRESAKDILWAPLLELNRRLELGLHFRENDGNVFLPNGSKILLKGAGNKREIDKLRGIKYPIAVVDEAQNFTTQHLEYLLNQVIEPSTLDYGKDGQVLITGTPNAACAGYFYEATAKGRHGWKTYKWTVRENPHIAADVDQFLEETLRRSNWPANHPQFLREYHGEWVRDAEGFVYRFKKEINTVSTFDPNLASDWDFMLGVDLGYNDPTAFVVLAYSEELGQAHVVESFKKRDLIPSKVAVEIELLMQRFRFSKIVCDTGGFGKGYAEELKQKHGMHVVPAKKRDKAAYVEMINSDLASGILKIAADENEELIEEMQLLQWNQQKLEDTGKLIEDSRTENHLCDGLLYAWRECMHHGDDWEANPPKPGTKEYEDAYEAELVERAKKRFASPEKDWWDAPASEDPFR